MENKKQKAFTLVELIVVITILAILGTIAFISLQGYSSQSRDSVRITDMSSIKTGLELVSLESGKYPLPSDETVITYSGAVAWMQGYFGEQTYKNLDKLDKIPIDPLTNKKYVYSTTSTRSEFQLSGVMEGDEVSYIYPLIPSYQGGGLAQAAEKTAKLKIIGNYNGKLLKVSTGSTNYVLAMPSIMSSSGLTVESITTNNLLAYDGYKNIPFQYSGTYKVLGEASINLVNPLSLVVYEGDLKVLSEQTSTGILARKSLIEKLQSAYTGTTIKNEGQIQSILLTAINDESAVERVSSTLISNNLGGSTSSSSSSSSSSTSSSGSGGGVDNTSCNTLFQSGETVSGVYNIDPNNNSIGFNVYCIMGVKNGGWTVLGKNSSTGSYTHAPGFYNDGNIPNGTTNGSISIENFPNTVLGNSTSFMWYDTVNNQYVEFSLGNIETVKASIDTFSNNPGFIGLNYLSQNVTNISPLYQYCYYASSQNSVGLTGGFFIGASSDTLSYSRYGWAYGPGGVHSGKRVFNLSNASSHECGYSNYGLGYYSTSNAILNNLVFMFK